MLHDCTQCTRPYVLACPRRRPTLIPRIDLTISSDEDSMSPAGCEELPRWLAVQRAAPRPRPQSTSPSPAAAVARTMVGECAVAQRWRQLHAGWVAGAQLSADGSLLATAGAIDRTVRLLRRQASGDYEAALQWVAVHPKPIAALALSRCGRLIATGSHDRSAKLLCTSSGAVLRHWPMLHEAWLCAVCFSLDGRHLATASEDNSVKLLDISDAAGGPGTVVWHAQAVHPGPVWTLSFSRSGQLLATGGKGPDVKVLATGLPSHDGGGRVVLGQSVSTDGSFVRAVAFLEPLRKGGLDGDDELLAVGSDDCGLQVISAASGRTLWSVPHLHAGPVASIAASQTGQTLIIASGAVDGVKLVAAPAACGGVDSEQRRGVVLASVPPSLLGFADAAETWTAVRSLSFSDAGDLVVGADDGSVLLLRGLLSDVDGSEELAAHCKKKKRQKH